MARIRTIKPEFGRDERLQDLEIANPGQHCMLVFACLWCYCDKNGVFLWNSRVLHLDILPFVQFDFDKTLVLLREALVIDQYKGDDEKVYGIVKNFSKHQRISGKEAIEPAKYPVRSNGEAVEKHLEWQEGERVIGKGKGEIIPPDMPALNYAIKIIEDVGMTDTNSNRMSIEAAVRAQIRDGKSGPSAYEFLVAVAKDEIECGGKVDKFFFEDQKWLGGKGNGKQQPSPAASRSNRSVESVLDAVRINRSRAASSVQS